jgi:hypothetical protein
MHIFDGACRICYASERQRRKLMGQLCLVDDFDSFQIIMWPDRSMGFTVNAHKSPSFDWRDLIAKKTGINPNFLEIRFAVQNRRSASLADAVFDMVVHTVDIAVERR